ncbi:stalk domain-containing protein [Anaerotignum sp. MB30-C6]|uniref:stalk domain-containing protein n=1 Tax=Anaerotignum sp. MB30-C6 TaxID=3070814 RepID=UPI0027DB97A9|nr:stalk domain-containing protein [Anaerotignum sp. MB30-C6]WMI81243.1 stalk domain-containing protein [Anaerotignum sp. MB30-C6]
MKKFISFVMAGAMVASLVPATAFAKGEVSATAKVVDALEEGKGFDGEIKGTDVPELQLKITSTDYQISNSSAVPEMDVTVTLENADFGETFDDTKHIGVRLDDPDSSTSVAKAEAALAAAEATRDSAEAAYEKAIKDADVSTDQAVIDATTAVTDATDAVTDATTAVTDLTTEKNTAETAKNDAQALEEAAHEAYLTAVETNAADVDAKRDAWKAAQTTTADKQAVLDAKVAALAAAEATLATAKTTLTEKEDALKAAETAAAGDVLAVKTALAELNKAKAAVTEAEKTLAEVRAGEGTVLIENFKKTDDDQIEFTIIGKLHKDDIVYVDLVSKMDSRSEGKKATVSVDSKMVKADDLVYATILGKGLKASIKKTVDVAEEEVVKLYSNGVKIESVVGDFVNGQKFELKLSKGFEFTKAIDKAGVYDFGPIDDNKVEFTYEGAADDEFTIEGDHIEIEATTAKSGAVATLTVKAIATKGNSATISDSVSVEVAKVVDYKVSLTVDEDEDLPVIYSGVNDDNKGITDDSDHLSLEVTAKESFPGAWSMRQGFNLNLPEGVYVTAVEGVDAANFFQNGVDLDKDGKDSNNQKYTSTDAWEDAFVAAYKEGDHKNFEFKKRVFDDVNTNVTDNKAAEVTFQLKLVADPTFEGEVKLTLEGGLVDKQEVTIAKFVKPYTVKAEQNDLIIDYRNTEIKTPIVITEAEEGLWEKGAEFSFSFDKEGVMEFEDDATFEIDKDSELDVKDDTKKDSGTLKFTVKEESDSAATVTIKDMKLFMNRNIPAGAYDLEIRTTMADAYDKQRLFAADEATVDFDKRDKDKESFVDDVCDYSDVVKEAFVNVVTSGRDQDNLFTTKVVVPVGEAYLIAGENKVELDVAAYISDAGYTMLPVRAISKALGVNTNNVLWNAESRTVTIMYGQRIITMTVGQKVIYVNGSAIPSSAAPEIKGERTFLPLRDLGTALGVTDVKWDAATKTATLNGGK